MRILKMQNIWMLANSLQAPLPRLFSETQTLPPLPHALLPSLPSSEQTKERVTQLKMDIILTEKIMQ